MKVVFLSQHFDAVVPPDQNSIGIWTFEVARRLSISDETIIIARRSKDMPRKFETAGIHFEMLACAPSRVWGDRLFKLWSRLRPRSDPLFAQSFYALDYLIQACRRIRKLAPDVVHLQNFPQHVPAIRRAVPEAAIVLHMHCDWLAQLSRDSMARSIAAADLVVGCSDHVVSAARNRFTDMDVPFAVLPNGAPVERLFEITARRKPGQVLFVGRLSPEKGIHVLMQAWPKVVAARPEAHLQVVGGLGVTPREFLVDLSDDQDVRGLSRYYSTVRAPGANYEITLQSMIPPKIANTVTFVSIEPYARVIERYATAAVLVNPSLSESFGMSLVEAMATGTPVIATNAGGMPEIIEATGGGVLVEKNNVNALADAIIDSLANPTVANKAGRQGAKRVAELYSWSRIACLTHKIHAEALATKTRRK
jgi:glycosyltransferase involved in cell wall biosynthesis